MSDGMRSALDRFKSALVGSMSATEPNAANLIDCAIARTLGAKDDFDFPKDHPQLLMMMQTVKGVLGKFQGIGGNVTTEGGVDSSMAGTPNGGQAAVNTDHISAPLAGASIEAKKNVSLADALDAAKEDATTSVTAVPATASLITVPARPELCDATEAPANDGSKRPLVLTQGGRLASPETTRQTRSSSKRPHETDDEAEAEFTKDAATPFATKKDGPLTSSPDVAAEGKKDKDEGFTLELRSRKKRSP